MWSLLERKPVRQECPAKAGNLMGKYLRMCSKGSSTKFITNGGGGKSRSSWSEVLSITPSRVEGWSGLYGVSSGSLPSPAPSSNPMNGL